MEITPPPIAAIGARIAQLRQTLPTSVRLIAVTKYVPVELMRAAYAAGIRDFGENRVQETVAKQAELKDLTDVTWHLIGHLQSNKAKQAIEHFDWIHTLDSLDLAARLDQYAAQQNQSRDLLVQVKLLPDPSKFGWSVDELWQALPQLDQYQHLNIRGLMTILPLELKPQEQLQAFKDLQTLSHEIGRHPWSNIQMQQLSMGMSGDFRLAIQAGATMIRLGTIIFGARST
jgi:pyridoxal phosphate enzyme (YggS family)